MSEMNYNNTNKDSDSIGEVQIANEVVSTIAGISAAEVEGVVSMAGGFKNEIAGKFGVKNFSKGVKVDILEDEAIVDIAINMRYGYNIPKTSKEVQDKVAQAIENMTGLRVTEVNVRIAGVCLENEE